MRSAQNNDENRRLKTNQIFPTPNKPDPMPQNLACLFTKITPEPGWVSCWYVVQDMLRERRVGLFNSSFPKQRDCRRSFQKIETSR